MHPTHIGLLPVISISDVSEFWSQTGMVVVRSHPSYFQADIKPQTAHSPVDKQLFALQVPWNCNCKFLCYGKNWLDFSMKIKNRINVEVMMSTLVVPSPAPSDPDASAWHAIQVHTSPTSLEASVEQ